MDPHLELIEKVYENEESLLDALDPDVEWHETEGMPYGGVFRGKQAVLENVFAHIGADWDGFGATPHTWLSCGERVVTLGEYHGTSRRTGQPMRAAFAHVYTLREGKIVQFRQVADSSRFRKALE